MSNKKPLVGFKYRCQCGREAEFICEVSLRGVGIGDAPAENKEGEQLRTTAVAQNNGTGGNPIANMPVTSGVA